MKKNFFALLFIFSFSGTVFPYISKYIDVSTNSLEYRLLIHPEEFSLKTAALIASGVSQQNWGPYLAQISNFEAEIMKSAPWENKTKQSFFIFQQMHKKMLTQYIDSATTLDVLLKSGKFNCLSSTTFYNSLLEDFGIPCEAAALPTHVFTLLNLDGREMDVENTSPYGFDIGTNQKAQESFKKLTGFEYARISNTAEIIGKRALIAYNYANNSYFANKANQPYSSFQNALKAAAIYPQGRFVYTNVIAAYSSYVSELANQQGKFSLALDILEEAYNYLPEKEFTVSNYNYVLRKYLFSLIAASRLEEANTAYEKSKMITGVQKDLEALVQTEWIGRTAKKDKNFEKGYFLSQSALKENPSDTDIQNVVLDSFYFLSEEAIKGWKSYPVLEETILKWHGLMKDSRMDDALANYYSSVALKFHQAGNPDKGIEVMRKGLLKLSFSSNLKTNLFYISANTANAYLKKGELLNGKKYIKIAMEADPKNEKLLYNLKMIYQNSAGMEIEKENYSEALKIVNEGLGYFPEDKKLIYYRDYINKKQNQR
jgi:tetratricopeptide (TPR) repeat protein